MTLGPKEPAEQSQAARALWVEDGAAWALVAHLRHGVRAGYLRGAPAWWVESIQLELEELRACGAGRNGSEDKGR